MKSKKQITVRSYYKTITLQQKLKMKITKDYSLDQFISWFHKNSFDEEFEVNDIKEVVYEIENGGTYYRNQLDVFIKRFLEIKNFNSKIDILLRELIYHEIVVQYYDTMREVNAD